MPGKVITRRAVAGLTDAGANLLRSESRTSSGQLHQTERKQPVPSYYNVSILKSPVWKWEIATYFFLGGVSTGSYLIGRAAGRFGGKAYEDVARAGAYTAFATLLPCPPLLIHDLGDPQRFHHMLRVWKPSTPMNLGTWAIMAYSGMATFEVVRQYLTDHAAHLSPRNRGELVKLMNNGKLLLLHDAAGVPAALVVAGYTGVLLSCTANPLWSKNTWIGPLFSASALATGAEATSLVMSLKSGREQTKQQKSLMHIDTLAHAIELICNVGFMKSAGEKAKPLHSGAMAKHHKFSVFAIVAAEVLKFIPTPAVFDRLKRVMIASLGLAGGFALRWSMVHGGITAATDPAIARLGTSPKARELKAGEPKTLR